MMYFANLPFYSELGRVLNVTELGRLSCDVGPRNMVQVTVSPFYALQLPLCYSVLKELLNDMQHDMFGNT